MIQITSFLRKSSTDIRITITGTIEVGLSLSLNTTSARVWNDNLWAYHLIAVVGANQGSITRSCAVDKHMVKPMVEQKWFDWLTLVVKLLVASCNKRKA